MGNVFGQLWMHVESEGAFSYQKVFRWNDNADGPITFPVAVAVVSVTDGSVDGVSWDFGCFDCDASQCKANAYRYSGESFEGAGEECWVKDEDCNPAKGDCNLKVYVTWSGTDKRGDFLFSQQKRLSNFQQGSTGL